ncbi:nucleotidyltransferase [Metamycoplasma hyosynoviae]|uniref:nucleotidyltransferase n=1 Tax=Metamycoplasma hyosynoviae TaxID=29559 RepID=UPI0023584378|nr:nucleotidyltransferase [Metamycoplasma hyosynoviae]MDC8937185.1 nucleotidyltransferase [Metamycoplasma hyosynoviae]MDD7897164.1 nucleotidyltransferase [Metamycoplasma hyosynoviae]
MKSRNNQPVKIGLIAEFNPFHNGHAYLINIIKEQFPNCSLIIALSSDFTQRGDIAILDYETRKQIALSYGANKVIKLGVEISTQAAHIYAEKAILALLKEQIEYLAFGINDKTATVDDYIYCANQIKNNFDTYNKVLQFELDKGKSFVYSASEALKTVVNKNILPEDILAFEYIKYIVFNNLDIKPIAVNRLVEHNSDKPNGNIASGSYIRKLIEENKDYSKYTPIKISRSFNKIQEYYERFQMIVFATPASELKDILLMDEGMENLFKKNIYKETYEEFIDSCVSTRYIRNRIKRVFVYTLLGMKKPKN